ncbi:MAG TPA: TlpA disulfide reductase family protein [Steroidobacteraceae bacterium]|nr:TlpA disulfide reductase family protein [Steroidobacteraceae bacterium]
MSRSPILLLAGLAGLALASPPVAATPLHLAAYRGRVVYLDFWASWCGPCKQSFPWMESMSDTYAHRGLVIVAVDLDRHKGAAARFLGEFHPDFQILYDPRGSLAERFKVEGMPTSLVIDRDGKLRYRHIGFVPADADRYESQVKRLLAEK